MVRKRSSSAKKHTPDQSPSIKPYTRVSASLPESKIHAVVATSKLTDNDAPVSEAILLESSKANSDFSGNDREISAAADDVDKILTPEQENRLRKIQAMASLIDELQIKLEASTMIAKEHDILLDNIIFYTDSSNAQSIPHVTEDLHSNLLKIKNTEVRIESQQL